MPYFNSLNDDAINFTVTIKNTGNDVNHPFNVAVIIDADRQTYPSGFKSFVVVESIKNGETKRVYINGSYLISKDKEFSNIVAAVVDESNFVTESNETNNILRQQITIPPISTPPSSPTSLLLTVLLV